MSNAYIVVTAKLFRQEMRLVLNKFREAHPADEEMNTFVMELDAACAYFPMQPFHVPAHILRRLYMNM